MQRAKKLGKDIILFGIASFGPKILSFFLVPLYTSLLTATDYGTADLLSTICSLALPVLMLDISDAITIRTVEWRSDKVKNGAPLKYGTVILIKACIILLAFLVLSSVFFKYKPGYLLYIFSNFAALALYNNLIAYLRGNDDVNTLVIASVIQATCTLIFNVVLILCLRMGLYGLLIASVASTLVADFYIMVKIKCAELFGRSPWLTADEKRGMLRYSIPLVFTGLAWWVNGSSDRFFIVALTGVGANGIYAVANKIPTILNACHSVVYQAMQLSVFNERKAEDREEYFRTLYNVYSFTMSAICSLVIIFDKVLAKFLFKGEFYVAWKYAPALLISIVLFSTAGYLTAIYAAESETKLIAKATVSGALVNTMFNALLIPFFDLFGAVIATAVGYFVIWFKMVMNAKKVIAVRIPIAKSIIGYCILVFQWILLLIDDSWGIYLLQVVLFALIALIYHKTVSIVIELLKRELKKRNKRVS